MHEGYKKIALNDIFRFTQIDTFFMVILGAWLSLSGIGRFLGLYNSEQVLPTASIMARIAVVLSSLFFVMWRSRVRTKLDKNSLNKVLEALVSKKEMRRFGKGVYETAKFLFFCGAVFAIILLCYERCIPELGGWATLFVLWLVFDICFPELKKGGIKNEIYH